jgi:DNA-binding response OmpR family regulator
MSSRMNFQVVPLSELPLKGSASQSDRPKPIVLVVDDERIIADTLTAILTRNGMSVMTAYDGRTALDIARTIPPDLLLTDVVMPDMSGIDLAIAVNQTIPNCKVLLFSGQATTANLLATANDAGHDFTMIAKPIHPKELLVRVSETLQPETINAGSTPFMKSAEETTVSVRTYEW